MGSREMKLGRWNPPVIDGKGNLFSCWATEAQQAGGLSNTQLACLQLE